MPFFRRKTVPAPLPGPHQQQQQQQQQQQLHWVAYMYAPHQPVAMPSMYPLQPVGPYGYLPAANAKYALHRSTLPVQYIPSSSAYSNTPHRPPTSLPARQLVHSSVETDYHHHHTPRTRHRPSSGTYPGAPFSRGSESGHYTDSEYTVDVHTQPAKHGVFSTLMNIARGRSKSRGRAEVERPRSRGAFTDDDGHDRGRAKDPRYRRDRRLSGEKDLKKAKHESLNAFDKSMESLEKSLRAASLTQDDPYRIPASIHRSSTKEDLKRKYEEEDRLQEEYQRAQAQAQAAQMRNRAVSPDVPQSPTLIEHTKLNARQHYRPDSGYHTDAPAPKSARRQSVPLHLMQSPREKPPPTLNVPEGFFNRRGDQLMNSKGDVLRRPPHMEYPPEFAAYPHPGTGWRDHKGQLVGPDLRWIRKVG